MLFLLNSLFILRFSHIKINHVMDAIRIVLACIKNADKDFNLINDGDRIAIGVSGGKDSMLLLYSLVLYRKFSKIKFDIIPININLGFPGYDSKGMEEYCKSLGLELVIADGSSVYEILSIQKERQHKSTLPCSICSKMKKAIINKKAKELKCNKVSFAHHKNDAIETLFLNEIYGGRMATFSPKMTLSKENITFIRPLIYADESDIKRAIKETNIPVFSSHCPNDRHTKREDIKHVISRINEEFPASRDNFLTMLMNKEKMDIFYEYKLSKINNRDFYYKEINDISNFLLEKKFINSSDKVNQKSKHIHLYKKEKLVGVLLLSNEENNFYIEKIGLKENSSFIPFIFTLYKDLFLKFNPLHLYIKDSKYKNEMKVMEFQKVQGKRMYKIQLNPVKLELKLKKEGLI